MNKIPTVFIRDPATNLRNVKNEVNPPAAWVLAGEGTPTRKYDGTCVMYEGDETGLWWARREVKAGKEPPLGFRPIETDEITGKTVGWEPAEQSGFVKWLSQAITGAEFSGTYELCGPKINGNPEGFEAHVLIPHDMAEKLDDAPRDFAALREWLLAHDYEGIVWHHDDGRMAKLKKRDFI